MIIFFSRQEWYLFTNFYWWRAVFVVTGMALSFTPKSGFINGMGIGLVLIGAVGFIIDGFARQRAKVYTSIPEAEIHAGPNPGAGNHIQ